MHSEVDIANFCMADLGLQPITSLDEGSRAADLFRRVFPLKRDEILASHPWNCAIRRAVLAKLAEPPAFGYGARFQCPINLLRCITINESREGWRREGRYILTDAAAANATYISRLLNAGDIDPIVSSAIGTACAAELASALLRDDQKKRELMVVYEQKMIDAKFADSSEQWGERIRAENVLAARLSNQSEHVAPYGR